MGRDHCCYAYLHKPSAAISRIQLTSFDEPEVEEQLPTLFETLRGHDFESVVVSSAFPQALLYPQKYFKDGYTALDLVYDQPMQAYFHDRIFEWQIVNMYAMPKAVNNAIREAFVNVQYFHTYTPTIKIYNGYVADQQLSVHFTGQYFQVMLKKDAAVHLLQTYAYKTPLDVIYYLLKICYEFNLPQAEVFVILSGLVARESALFTDLQQYFTNLHFAQQPEISLPESPYPQYFFTSIYNLAACVL